MSFDFSFPVVSGGMSSTVMGASSRSSSSSGHGMIAGGAGMSGLGEESFLREQMPFHDFPGRRVRMVYDSNMPREQLVALKRARKRQLNRESAHRVREKRKLESTAYETQLRATRTALEVARKQLADILMERNELRRRLAKYENATTTDRPSPMALISGPMQGTYNTIQGDRHAFGEPTIISSNTGIAQMPSFATRGVVEGISSLPALPAVGLLQQDERGMSEVDDLSGAKTNTSTDTSAISFGDLNNNNKGNSGVDLWTSSVMPLSREQSHVITSGSAV
ncbi:hypothetical protein FOZ61_001928 [Perkinsus olseni]|uniref:BZIP domain-containing protein n=1 Tax=Perkinsus olseni TaxID=32597 RepID=A0A7J6LV78_PEROL|nr:hypothetical protein FOZ61_001928 [Perkinsus olseni]